MNTNRQSPLPTPQSPLIALGGEKLNTQLVLEERLRIAAEELLEVYKNHKQWKQVAQVAQTLNSNLERITCIQDCLTSYNVFQIPPTETDRSRGNEIPPLQEMVEDPDGGTVSVKLVVGCGRATDDPPNWEVTSAQHSNGRHVSRTHTDVSLLLKHLCKNISLGAYLSDDGLITSREALQEFLKEALEDPSTQSDSLLVSFLSPSVDDFSTLATKADQGETF